MQNGDRHVIDIACLSPFSREVVGEDRAPFEGAEVEADFEPAGAVGGVEGTERVGQRVAGLGGDRVRIQPEVPRRRVEEAGIDPHQRLGRDLGRAAEELDVRPRRRGVAEDDRVLHAQRAARLRQPQPRLGVPGDGQVAGEQAARRARNGEEEPRTVAAAGEQVGNHRRRGVRSLDHGLVPPGSAEVAEQPHPPHRRRRRVEPEVEPRRPVGRRFDRVPVAFEEGVLELKGRARGDVERRARAAREGGGVDHVGREAQVAQLDRAATEALDREPAPGAREAAGGRIDPVAREVRRDDAHAAGPLEIDFDRAAEGLVAGRAVVGEGGRLELQPALLEGDERERAAVGGGAAGDRHPAQRQVRALGEQRPAARAAQAVREREILERQVRAGQDVEEALRAAEVDDVGALRLPLGAAHRELPRGARDPAVVELVGAGQREHDGVRPDVAGALVMARVGRRREQRLAQRAVAVGQVVLAEGGDRVERAARRRGGEGAEQSTRPQGGVQQWMAIRSVRHGVLRRARAEPEPGFSHYAGAGPFGDHASTSFRKRGIGASRTGTPQLSRSCPRCLAPLTGGGRSRAPAPRRRRRRRRA